MRLIGQGLTFHTQCRSAPNQPSRLWMTRIVLQLKALAHERSTTRRSDRRRSAALPEPVCNGATVRTTGFHSAEDTVGSTAVENHLPFEPGDFKVTPRERWTVTELKTGAAPHCIRHLQLIGRLVGEERTAASDPSRRRPTPHGAHLGGPWHRPPRGACRCRKRLRGSGSFALQFRRTYDLLAQPNHLHAPFIPRFARPMSVACITDELALSGAATVVIPGGYT